MDNNRNVVIVDESGKVLYKDTCKAIASCASLSEAVNLMLKIKAFEEYSKVLGQSELITKLRLRAQRKIGEITKGIPTVVGQIPLRSVKETAERSLSDRETKEQILRKYKISKEQARKWEIIANIPEAEFEIEVERPGVTLDHLVEYAKDPDKAKSQRQERQTRKREQQKAQTKKQQQRKDTIRQRLDEFNAREEAKKQPGYKPEPKPKKPKFTDLPQFGQSAEWYSLVHELRLALERAVSSIGKQQNIVKELLDTGRIEGMRVTRGTDLELRKIHEAIKKLRPILLVLPRVEDNYEGRVIDGVVEVIH